VPLVFTREGDALGVAFLVAAMGHIYVNWRLSITQAAIASRLPQLACCSVRCPQRIRFCLRDDNFAEDIGPLQGSASAPLYLEHIIRPPATAPAILF
jgi:hypothetical protein